MAISNELAGAKKIADLQHSYLEGGNYLMKDRMTNENAVLRESLVSTSSDSSSNPRPPSNLYS